ncbi:universal stress protein [Halomonas organivorans]|uniref:Nucleotide-binding universal stress UspA family protein n=1 Tax=Halomonas organivorans TaxID=257772 RepID=A0A7W5BXU6_9GAMM|nr:universal stress protein [Halomonas organivorans]MBB3140663.1 nucleotide-binding universal stress UspA family protein [Halomonas organivorans]
MTPHRDRSPTRPAGIAGREGELPLAAARVLALLDASRFGLAALGAAVHVAERQGRELLVLYVEDQDLLLSAAFPFAREIGGYSGRVRRLSVAGLEAGLARQGEQLRRALELAVAGRGVRHSLCVRRGRVVEETLSLTVPGDLLLLGKAGLTGRTGAWQGSTGRGLILAAPCPVVIWDEAQGAVSTGPLRVLTPGIDGEPPPVPDPLSALFGAVEPIPRADAASLARRLAVFRGGALLLRRDDLRVLMDEVPDWLSRVTIPVIVVP